MNYILKFLVFFKWSSNWLEGKRFYITGSFNYDSASDHTTCSYLGLSGLSKIAVSMYSDSMYTNITLELYSNNGQLLSEYSLKQQGSKNYNITTQGATYCRIYLYQGVGNETQQGGHTAYLEFISIE